MTWFYRGQSACGLTHLPTLTSNLIHGRTRHAAITHVLTHSTHLYSQVWPITDYPVNEINENSQKMIKKHEEKYNEERFLKQVS